MTIRIDGLYLTESEQKEFIGKIAEICHERFEQSPRVTFSDYQPTPSMFDSFCELNKCTQEEREELLSYLQYLRIKSVLRTKNK